MTGKFIVFEGGEGAGKTTQIRRLYQWLMDCEIVRSLQNLGYLSGILTTREPGGSPLGNDIRRLLLEYHLTSPDDAIAHRTELLLYAADRAQHIEQYLIPHLKQNSLILCDRYTDSTVAYQGYGRGLDLSLIETLNQIATGGLQSDLTLWLDLDVEIGLSRTHKRGHADRMEQNHRQFHEQVRRGFQALAKAHPHRIVRIDAEADEHTVARAIQSVVLQKFHEWYSIQKD